MNVDSAEEQLDALLLTVKQAFGELEATFNQQYADKDFLVAKSTIAKLQFVEKMLREIDSAEAVLFD